ncbi:MAG: 4Fe-4S dicluster domain-containing protein [Pseudomonadota bacterium]
MYLLTNPDKCTGCVLCELACSFHNENIFSPSLSRISVFRQYMKGVFIPLSCAQCEAPMCEPTCPLGAISKNTATGAWEVNVDRCQGCKMCLLVCPLGGMGFNKEKGVALKCDFCGGNPECVIFCPTGALEIIEDEQLAVIKKKKSLKRMAEVLTSLVE